jgi:hypothetical protein
MKLPNATRLFSTCLILVVLLIGNAAIGQIWTEDFEVDGEGSTYTSSFVFNDGPTDHYGRTDGTNVTGGYNGQSGSWFIAGEDLDDNGGDLSTSKTITFNALDVTGVTSLQFRGLFATGNPDNGWDDLDVLRVEYNMDAAGWNTLFAFTTDLPGSNQGLYFDSDGDLIGDIQMTATFSLVAVNIPVTGSSLELRIFAEANSGGEQFAFDQIQLFDTSAAVNGCTDPAADNYNPAATVDDGSCIFSGCTDPTALNYDPNANLDNGSCVFTLPNLVINEIHYNGDDANGFPDGTVEFLEIYNYSGAAVDLTDYSFVGVTATFPALSSIADGEFVVVALTPATYEGNGYQVFPFSGALGNTGELVQLLDPNGLVVDEVTYSDSGAWPIEADGTGPSLELINYDLDNNDGASWCANGPVNGTPGAQNSCFMVIVEGCTNPDADNYDPAANLDDGSCVIGGCTDPAALNYNTDATYDDGSCAYAALDVVINEIHYNPCTAQGDDTAFEFLELYNNEPTTVDLTGWQLQNAVTYTFGAVTMAPGEYIVIAVVAASYEGNGYQVFQWEPGGLNNTSEGITLVDSNGSIADDVVYSDSAPWPTSADGGCPSLELIDPSLDNSDAANWQASYVPNGTPGAVNSTQPPAANYTIVELQSEDHAGEFIATSGVVTGVYGASNLFTIQDGAGAYSGIWVEGAGVAIGDEVDVEGPVAESFDLTLISATQIVILTSGNALPAPEPLATLAVSDEQWEGVLISTLGEVDNGDIGFGEWSVNDGSGSAIVDDLGYLFTPAPEGINFGVTGPLYFSFGAFKIEPRDANDVVRYGCTDNTFANYDPLAVVDDGSCSNLPGCTNPNADNYDPDAVVDDGSCIVTGCTDINALNYDIDANNNDGSCYFTEPVIVINEIHYNPCTAQGDDFDFEFVELYNDDTQTIDLEGFTFVQGFEFTFPAGASIAPGEYIVIAALAATYQGNGYQVFQVEFDNLSNNGEAIELHDAFGNILDIVVYDDIAPWPTAANVGCASLELIDPALDNSLAESWQPSWIDNGTPGAENSSEPEGCTDPEADNYDPIAIIDDGTCIYLGCTDPVALNYDDTATQDDGSCQYAGCTYPDADNYDPIANLDDGSCVFTNSCPADLNGDGIVNAADLLAFLGAFGTLCN